MAPPHRMAALAREVQPHGSAVVPARLVAAKLQPQLMAMVVLVEAFRGHLLDQVLVSVAVAGRQVLPLVLRVRLVGKGSLVVAAVAAAVEPPTLRLLESAVPQAFPAAVAAVAVLLLPGGRQPQAVRVETES